MPQTGISVMEHEITVLAPAGEVYQLVADVTNWPRIFPPSVHVEYLERGDTEERIEIWATANGEAKTWKSRRVLDHDALRVGFRQEVSTPPVAQMGGAWVIEPVSDTECRVRLHHDFRAVDDDPAKRTWIEQAVDRNSRSELAAMKAEAESAAAGSQLLSSFEDTVEVEASAKAVYQFIDEAQLWEERLPHVARVSLREDTPGLQLLEMDTRTKDGSVHTTKSVRVCFPHDRIYYKQIVLPALMTLHTGCWLFEEHTAGVSVTSRHTVAINAANVDTILGAGSTVADARTFVHNALSTNSLATLRLAKEHAERQ